MFEKFNLLSNEELLAYSKDEYYKFRITLEGFYGWGVGYYNDDCRYDFEAVTRSYVRNFAEHYTDNVKFSYDFHENGHCDEITPNIGNNPTSAYLHPMDFTGCGKAEFIDGLVEAVKKGLSELGLEDKYKIGEVKQELVPFIPEREYEEILVDHTNEILDEVRKSREFKKWAGKDVDFLANCAAEDFMRHADIDRAGKGSGFSSFDRAYLTVRNIVNITDKVGALEKTHSKRLEID